MDPVQEKTPKTAYASEAPLQNGSQLATLVDTQGNAGANLRRRV